MRLIRNLQQVLLGAVIASAALAPLPAQEPAASSTDVPVSELKSFTQIKLASWNIAHFVDSHDSPYVSNSLEDAPDRTPEELRRIAAVIRTIDADVLVVQEIESSAWLRGFAKEYFPEMKYQWFVAGESDNWYQNVAIASRVPLGVTEVFTEKLTPVVGSEPPMVQNKVNNRVVIQELLPPGSRRILLAGVHFKAGGEARDRGTRVGTIDALKERLAAHTQIDPGLPIIVMGDFNFTPADQEFQRITGTGEPELFSVFEEWGFPATHPAGRARRHIDQILVNSRMEPDVIEGSASVALVHPPRTMDRLSDHLPVVVTINTRPEAQ